MTLYLRDPPRETSTTLIRQPLAPPWRLWLLRLGLVALSLFLWFFTQSLLVSRPPPRTTFVPLDTYDVPDAINSPRHTALAILYACVFAKSLTRVGAIILLLIALFDITTVIFLRAHFTIAIFTDDITALCIWTVAKRLGPP